MVDQLSQDVLERALEDCAAEPVHIPGIVQPFGCLLAADKSTGVISYASENTEEIIGIPVSKLLGQNLENTFGSHIVHGLNNAAASSGYQQKTTSIGEFEIGDSLFAVSAFGSDGKHVIEMEAATAPEFGERDALSTLSFLMERIQSCQDQETLLNLTAELMRHVSGYDRVMVYKFDAEFNGEVRSEVRARGMEPYLGLHFPHWDIPAQARAIMQKLPLRFIQNIDHTPVPLRAGNASLPPLDITFAACRGVSPVHMQYLRNMGIAATMTLSIVIDDALWGMISFHHRKPRVPAPKLRELLTSFVGLFSIKLQALQQQDRLALVAQVDQIKGNLLKQIDTDENLEDAMERVDPLIQEVMGAVDAVGVAVRAGSKTEQYGKLPGEAVLKRLTIEAEAQPGTPIIVENLAGRFPDLAADLNGCAGALVTAYSSDRALYIFREEISQSISWAGNPEKTVETVSGQSRLIPRGSFSTYMQEISGFCKPWSDQDVYFANRIWALVNSAERRALVNTLTRQQSLMIDELNHRVRNILALVRSVSRQARKQYGSLQSYSKALEARIQALASAHDIASSASTSAIEIKRLIGLETEPYNRGENILISGPTKYLRADIAPVVSLVIHELATNAAKYGALSVDTGEVEVIMSEEGADVSIFWRERGGPTVSPPEERGFGTTLIEQAVPHELGGTAELRFAPTGVEAHLVLPKKILEPEPEAGDTVMHPSAAVERINSEPFSARGISGFVLILEDNYVIGRDMKDQLEDFGFSDIEVLANVTDALEVLENDAPVFAVLDVNLGPGESSEQVALRLLELGTPMIFVSGYGDNVKMPTKLSDVPRLTKPVSTLDLQDVLAKLIRVN